MNLLKKAFITNVGLIILGLTILLDKLSLWSSPNAGYIIGALCVLFGTIRYFITGG